MAGNQTNNIPPVSLAELNHIHRSWEEYIKERTTFLKDAYPFFDEPSKLKVFRTMAEGDHLWDDLIRWAKNTLRHTWKETGNGEHDAYDVTDFTRLWIQSIPPEVQGTNAHTKSTMDAFRIEMERQRNELCDRLRQLIVRVENLRIQTPNGERGEIRPCLNGSRDHK